MTLWRTRSGLQGRQRRLPSGKIRARYRTRDGKQHSATFDHVRPAQAWLRAQRTDVDAGVHVAPAKGRVTLGEYAEQWVERRRGTTKPSTERRVESLVRVHIVSQPIGTTRIAEVTTDQVQAWVSGRARLLAPSTLRNLVSYLGKIFDSAVINRLVGTSPVVRALLTLPSIEHPRLVPLTPTEVETLADAIPARNRAMVITQAGLGLRVGELLALTIGDVDFLRREVHIRHQLAPGARTRTAPKWGSRRVVPLPTVVAEVLAQHIEQFPPAPDGSIFYTRFGQPYRSDYYGLILARAVASAGLPAGTTSHHLRHAYASWLLEAGESVVAVAERLGHKNANLVLSTYGHLMPGREEATRRAVDSAFGVTGVSRLAAAD